ncbi:MAG: hypothetical protein LBK66_03535 [Spirochaetaceae bacterium]|nr:hypothetical protein [Spirochaetaceae bacterium]
MNAAPPPTAQTSLRRRQDANAERMRTHWQAGSRVCKPPFSDPTALSEDRFGYAGAERI